MTEALNAPFEIWTSRQATQLLSEKHICILGDSIQRMVYKDLVKFLSTNKLCNTFELRKKAEPYFNQGRENCIKHCSIPCKCSVVQCSVWLFTLENTLSYMILDALEFFGRIFEGETNFKSN